MIHAHAFRKLQSKTQVFLSGEYDFYRTRLTHSMEVAQIGRSICTWLLSRGAPLEPAAPARVPVVARSARWSIAARCGS